MRAKVTKSYALVGEADNARSLDESCFEDEVEDQWFSATVPRRQMKSLMRRTNREAAIHFGIWGALLIGSGTGAVLTWGSWWTVPFLLVYGVMYSMSDHQAHETSHGTPFRTRWLNDVLYWLNGFMTLHEPYYWRWSHTRHHTDTLHVGRDPEIAVMSPADLARLFLDFFFIVSGWVQIRNICRHALGRIEGDGEHFIPEGERRKVIWNSRAFVAVFGATVVAAVVWQSWLPILLVVTPRFYGGFFPQFFNITQACGAARKLQGSPGELSHLPHQSGLQVPVHEHELSRRAPHVPDGAVSPAACLARGDQGSVSAAVSERLGLLRRDDTGHSAAAGEPRSFRLAPAAPNTDQPELTLSPFALSRSSPWRASRALQGAAAVQFFADLQPGWNAAAKAESLWCHGS